MRSLRCHPQASTAIKFVLYRICGFHQICDIENSVMRVCLRMRNVGNVRNRRIARNSGIISSSDTALWTLSEAGTREVASLLG